MNAHQQFDPAEVVNFPRHGRHRVSRRDDDADHLALLLQELNHRIGNLLAMVEAVVRQTQSTGVDDYRAKVLARISGFRDFYQVMGGQRGQKVALAQLLQRTMGSYCSQQGRVVASGVDIDLEPELALALHLVFHELAMNASKYGALTTDAGRVTVEWKLRSGPDAAARLAIVWTERGGPTFVSPATAALARASSRVRLPDMARPGSASIAPVSFVAFSSILTAITRRHEPPVDVIHRRAPYAPAMLLAVRSQHCSRARDSRPPE